MVQALQLILALSFLVISRDVGHFAFARLVRVRVEKVYMFFNPKISLIRAKKFNGKWHVRFFAKNVEPAAVEVVDTFGNQKKDEKGNVIYRPMTEEELARLPEDDWRHYPDSTEWGIGWVPFGGYCAIAGMVDETKSATDLPSEPQPWEFRSKNVFQRFCIIIGGILVNFVAALLIFGLLLFHYGTDTLPLRNVDSGLYYSDIMRGEGFEQQDKILTVNGEEPETLGDVVQWIIIEGRRDVKVLRGSDTIALTMSEDLGNRYLALQNEFERVEREKARADRGYLKHQFVLLAEYVPFVVDSVVENEAGYYAGLRKGDRIMGIDGASTPTLYEVQIELRKHPCDSISIALLREQDTLTTAAFIGDRCMLGVVAKSQYLFFQPEHTDYSFWQAMPAGVRQGWDFLVMYVKQFRLVFSKEGAQSVGGFGAIGNMFPKLWDWGYFWHITAVISLMLAFMNFLPIPALDGGYILFLLVEMITRKKPSDKFLEKANNIGFWLLMALVIFANGNDVFKAFF
ncbi:MAG: RIP metalloprotease RseP [Paludibacteraceae bacterium]|nr:RIP metalloprotease RseP [Paludibacteraceae bacterium]